MTVVSVQINSNKNFPTVNKFIGKYIKLFDRDVK